MLARSRRVNRPEDFRRVLRHGRRAGSRRLVIHLYAGGDRTPSRAGLVVGRTVGSSVDRHQVSRRLRHLLRERLDALPAGTDLVVRALGPAAGASSARLGEDVDTALRRLHGPDDQDRKR